MMLTENTIAFAKEIFANLENIERDNDDLEVKLTYYGGKLTQCDSAIENLPEEFLRCMYVGIEPDEDRQKPVPIAEATIMLSQKIDYLRECLEYNKKQQEELTSLLNQLKKIYPDLVEII